MTFLSCNQSQTVDRTWPNMAESWWISIKPESTGKSCYLAQFWCISFYVLRLLQAIRVCSVSKKSSFDTSYITFAMEIGWKRLKYLTILLVQSDCNPLVFHSTLYLNCFYSFCEIFELFVYMLASLNCNHKYSFINIPGLRACFLRISEWTSNYPQKSN